MNGNNNFLTYKYNGMEEYDYWMKTIRNDEVQRWGKKKSEDRLKLHMDHWFRAEDDPPMELDKYGLLKGAVELYIEEGIHGFQYFKTFTGYKARMTKGDYKLNGYWDRFRKQLYEYNGVKDVRGWMLNISPKWPDNFNHRKMANFLGAAIEKFAKQGNNWEEFTYVIETGKEANHLHAHCVMLPKEAKEKKMRTYMKKGNHNNWFRREFDNRNNHYPVGFEGCVKGRASIQIVQVNTNEIYKDKLDYLQEELKPEDHQNREKVMDPVRIEF